MSINAVITLTEDGESGVYLHTHGDIGSVSAFIKEAHERFTDGPVLISNYILGDTVKEMEARTSFYAVLYGVVREYLAYSSHPITKNIVTVKMYSTGITSSPLVTQGTTIMEINNDFSCDHIDTLIFSDNDANQYQKVREFFARTHDLMVDATKQKQSDDRRKKEYFHG